MHGFLSRDGIPPAEFAAICREQALVYPGVALVHGEVAEVVSENGLFTAILRDGSRRPGRRILLATGIVDELPEIEGLTEFYGISVHHCPYCDGWEHRNQPLAVLGAGQEGVEFALEMLGWTSDLIFFSNGCALEQQLEYRMKSAGIVWIETPIERLEGEAGKLRGIRLRTGELIPRSGLFFLSRQRQFSGLARQLGCDLDEEGCVACGGGVCTNVPGVFAAGNTTSGLQLAIVAAAEGAKAAWAINQSLLSASLSLSGSEVEHLKL